MGLFNNKYPYTDFHEINLDWILKTVGEVVNEVESLNEWKSQFAEEYAELKSIWNAILQGNFPESIKNAFADWMRRNAVNLVGALVKNVWFGLTDSGYFCAYIPSNWSDIVFKTTGLDIVTELEPEFGHLVIQY